MPDQSPILSLPLMQASQAQKHVTHNEALMRLDLLVQLAVSDRMLTVPPISPVEGQRHIVAPSPSGAWAGKAKKIAVWQDGAWQFTTPLVGWQAWVVAEGRVVIYDGTAWATVDLPAVLTATQLGVSATPDATNRLSVSSPATLFNHAGAGHQVKVNKAGSGDTASLLFQTGFSGRVELGTAGSDDFQVKVSATGSRFVTGLKVAAATGGVELPKPVLLTGQASDPAAPANGTIWHNSSVGQLRARVAGQTRVIDGQMEVPWLVPVAGELLITTMGSGGATTILAGAAGRIDLYPFIPRADLVTDGLGVNCTVAVAAALAKMVVYDSDALGRPNALLLETATVDLSTVGSKIAAASLTLLQGQTYWLGVRHNSTATLSAWGAQATPDINGGVAMQTTARKIIRRTVTFTSAAPTPWGFLSSEVNSASPTAIWLRQV